MANNKSRRVQRMAILSALGLAISAMMVLGGSIAAADPPQQSVDRQADSRAGTQRGPVTNLPLPRYVSLKGDNGNVRRGPSLSHRIDWVFRHAGTPLRVVAEFGHWRRIEDKDGAGGWIHYALLSGVRTAVVTEDMALLRSRADLNANVVARAQAGAIVRLRACKPDWCEIGKDGVRGWVPKTSIWGVDPDEIRE